MFRQKTLYTCDLPTFILNAFSSSSSPSGESDNSLLLVEEDDSTACVVNGLTARVVLMARVADASMAVSRVDDDDGTRVADESMARVDAIYSSNSRSIISKGFGSTGRAKDVSTGRDEDDSTSCAKDGSTGRVVDGTTGRDEDCSSTRVDRRRVADASSWHVWKTGS